MVKPPIAKSQFLIDFVGCFLAVAVVSGQAAPVMRMSEPTSPVRNMGCMGDCFFVGLLALFICIQLAIARC